jgi:hypothetical protein
MIVEGIIIIENKTVEKLLPIHEAPLLSYLKNEKLQAGISFQRECSPNEGWYQKDGESAVAASVDRLCLSRHRSAELTPKPSRFRGKNAV